MDTIRNAIRAIADGLWDAVVNAALGLACGVLNSLCIGMSEGAIFDAWLGPVRISLPWGDIGPYCLIDYLPAFVRNACGRRLRAEGEQGEAMTMRMCYGGNTSDATWVEILESLGAGWRYAPVANTSYTACVLVPTHHPEGQE